MPSIRSLARQIQVGIITTTKAFDELVLEGYLISRPSIGFFVKELNYELIISIQKNLIRDDVIELLTKLKETTLTKKDLIDMINELEEK